MQNNDGLKIMKQEDDLFAIYSHKVEDFLFTDLTWENVQSYFITHEVEETVKFLREEKHKLDRNSNHNWEKYQREIFNRRKEKIENFNSLPPAVRESVSNVKNSIWLRENVGDGRRFKDLEHLLSHLKEMKRRGGSEASFAGDDLDIEIQVVEWLITDQDFYSSVVT